MRQVARIEAGSGWPRCASSPTTRSDASTGSTFPEPTLTGGRRRAGAADRGRDLRSRHPDRARRDALRRAAPAGPRVRGGGGRRAGIGVEGFSRARLVSVPFQISCGVCSRCTTRADRPLRVGPFAVRLRLPPRGAQWGGFLSDLVRVPYAEQMLVAASRRGGPRRGGVGQRQHRRRLADRGAAPRRGARAPRCWWWAGAGPGASASTRARSPSLSAPPGSSTWTPTSAASRSRASSAPRRSPDCPTSASDHFRSPSTQPPTRRVWPSAIRLHGLRRSLHEHRHLLPNDDAGAHVRGVRQRDHVPNRPRPRPPGDPGGDRADRRPGRLHPELVTTRCRRLGRGTRRRSPKGEFVKLVFAREAESASTWSRSERDARPPPEAPSDMLPRFCTPRRGESMRTVRSIVGLGVVATTVVQWPRSPRPRRRRSTVFPGDSIQDAVDAPTAATRSSFTRASYRGGVDDQEEPAHSAGSRRRQERHRDQARAAPQQLRRTGRLASASAPNLARAPDRRRSGPRIRGFRVQGFRDFGAIAFNATKTTFRNNTFIRDDEYGVAAFSSRRTKFVDNVAIEGEVAGFYVGDSPHAKAVLRDNVAQTQQGVRVLPARLLQRRRRSQPGGPQLPRDGPHQHRLAGRRPRLDLRENRVLRNTPRLPGRRGRPPDLRDGDRRCSGQATTCCATTCVKGNGPSGAAAFPGGIVVASSVVASAEATPRTTGSFATGRAAIKPADIVWDGKGKGNRFERNHCGSSQPGGLCGCKRTFDPAKRLRTYLEPGNA